MLLSFSFNGLKKPYLRIEKGKRRSIFAPITRNLMSVPGKAGAYLSSTDTQVRVIQQPIFIEGKDKFDLRKLEEDMADWLITDEAVPLIFDDEPDRVYNALVDGSLDIEDIVNYGRGTITFICPDPYKYGETKESTIDSAVESFESPFLIHYDGKVPTTPVFEITLKDSVTHLDIIAENDYMRVGQADSVDNTPFRKYERIWGADGSTMTGWASAAFAPDGGVKSGAMGVLSGDFIATDYGTGLGWHGPVVSQSTGQLLSDFVIRAYFDIHPISGRRGRTEVYLLDETGAIIGKLAVVVRKSTGEVEVEINIRNGAKSYFFTSEIWSYKEFYGYIDIVKEGTLFTASVAQQGIDSKGKHYTRAKKIYTYNDINNEYQRDLAAVGMHIGAYSTFVTPGKTRIRGLDVERINQSTGIPFIGEAGDVFTFDHLTSKILKNGELFMQKDFGARFFMFKKGENVLVFNPPHAIDEARIEWRDRYR